MKLRNLLFLLLATPLCIAQDDSAPTAENDANTGAEANAEPQEIFSAEPTFQSASDKVQKMLTDALAELDAQREQQRLEKLPMREKLDELQVTLKEVTKQGTDTSRTLTERTTNITNLTNKIKGRRDDIEYLSRVLSQYLDTFDTSLHVSEIQRYREPLEEARLAVANTKLSDREILDAQAKLLGISIDRIEEVLGGTRFDGRAVVEGGAFIEGTFLLLGPAVLFASRDGQSVGTVELRPDKEEPSLLTFANPVNVEAARALIQNGNGNLPLDPTLGDAHKVEKSDKTTPVDEFHKGGPVMWAILGLASAALLVALLKGLSFLFVRKPSRRRMAALLDAVEKEDEMETSRAAARVGGPAGRMLSAGVAHIREPRELIEEVMYETVLTTRLRLQSFLPFVAISAASAPLLGLLGTVTGIIDTFKMIEIFGSSDVNRLSGGISEALITTKYGLIVAIPSLLLHAFLSRRARGIVDSMEKAAVAFVNQVSKTSHGRSMTSRSVGGEAISESAPSNDLVREQVSEIIKELLGSEGEVSKDLVSPHPKGTTKSEESAKLAQSVGGRSE